MKLLDPECGFILKWNKIFVLSSIVALSLDPLFLYIPVININGTHKCLDMDRNLAILLCVLRSFVDLLFVFHIILQFRTAYVLRYDHVLGKNILKDEPRDVAKRYLKSYFIIDVFAALPLPQLAVLVIIPNLDGPTSFSKEDLLKFIIFSQYVPRVIQTSLFYRKVTETSAFFIDRAWTGAAFNFFLYVLASYVFGALWYLFAIESALRCWNIACRMHNCHSQYLYCGKDHVGDFGFLDMSCPLLERNEIKDATNFDFGIYLDALQTHILETRDFRQKIVYCSLWGLQNLSSLGQGLKASTFYGEALFVYFIVIMGLGLYILLFGNMQKYLQSPPNWSRGMEEMKEKERQTEVFMSNMFFTEKLRQRVRRDKQNKWKITHGVELESVTRDLSPDLRKDINRHVFFPSVKRVPTFEHMDDHLLDAICDCLKTVHYTENSYLVREGDPVRGMLFITRGKVLSTITDGGKIGFFNARNLKAGDFFGEELLTWVSDPKNQQLPIYTRTVKAVTDVQAFALMTRELLQVVYQFWPSHKRHLEHTFRFYSQQWRTWATCYIQSAWRRYCKRKHAKGWEEANKRLGDALATARETFAARRQIRPRVSFNALCILKRNQISNAQVTTPKPKLMLQKPTQPIFDVVAASKLEHLLPIRVHF